MKGKLLSIEDVKGLKPGKVIWLERNEEYYGGPVDGIYKLNSRRGFEDKNDNWAFSQEAIGIMRGTYKIYEWTEEKIYKTSEMIAMLEVNPKLRFKAQDGTIASVEFTLLKLRSTSSLTSEIRIVKGSFEADEWTLIKPEPKPVSFLEAMNQNKRCKPKFTNRECHTGFQSVNYWLVQTELEKHYINGLWLIEDNDNE